MKEIIKQIDINDKRNRTLLSGDFHFLNNDDFIDLCNRLSFNTKNNKLNTIIIGTDIYIRFNGDLSDFGNEIGLKIGEYVTDDLGHEIDDLCRGIKHGVSIVDGTHFK